MTTIVFAADERYLPYVPCSLSQVARFGRRADGVVLIVPQSVSAGELDIVTLAAARHDVALDVVRVGELAPMLASGAMRDSRHVSSFTYSKLLLPGLLPDLDQVLYLDVDTLVRSPLDQILSWDLKHPIGAVPELGQNGMQIFGSTQVPYFNAGVLRMSLERLRQESLWEQALGILAEQPFLEFQDQDVLNLIFRDRFDALPLAFNVLEYMSMEHREWRRQNVEALSMSGSDVDSYITGDGSALFRVEGLVARARRSESGKLARRMLPRPVKRKAMSVLDRVAKPKLGVVPLIAPNGVNAVGRQVSPDGAPVGLLGVELQQAGIHRRPGA
jgi:hypothetical protein